MSAETTDESLRDREIAAEQRHVDVVYQRLDVLRAAASDRERAGYEHLKATVPGAQFERDVFVYNAARRVADIDAQHEGLVFGRIDSDEGRVRHIGRLGLRDADFHPLLLDWRAPAAAPFYQATPTDRQGIARRRVIRSSGQQVVDITDDLLDAASELPVIGDGALMAALSRKRTGRMRDIVATIQAEQDAAIRAPARGATIITGGPGTGKTVVALHRAAYLLYADRRRFEGAGILIVGPSNVFMRYIERVLPSLGEDTAALYSLGELFGDITATRQDDATVAAVKGSTRMRKLLARATRLTPPGSPEQLSIVYKGEVLRLNKDELTALRTEVHNKGHKPNAAKLHAGRALLVALWRKAKPIIDDLVPAEFSRELGSRSEFLAFLDRWWPTLTPQEVLRWLSDRAQLAEAASGILSRRETTSMASSLTLPDFSVSDVPLLDELAGQLGSEPKRQRSSEHHGVRELTTVQERVYDRPSRAVRGADYDAYAHVIVDEAQDLSPMQWRMLGRRGQLAGWTIVGDAAQSSWPDPAESRRAQDAAIRRGPRRRFHMTTNYRNSAEIFEYAASVVRREVPDADIPRAVRSTGVPPRVREIGLVWELDKAVQGAVAEALGEVDGTVGVIAARHRHEWLADLLGVNDRVSVVGPLESKGLEYDGVVVVDFDEIVREHSIRVGYVALTRATQLLIQLDVQR
ncbi:HelD family protein [Stackebrandtia soli]|uniref:HelD family protein n=1 Tax=Stackebrandtia soli TaxID=1892856 RepID=UPI0039ED73DC